MAMKVILVLGASLAVLPAQREVVIEVSGQGPPPGFFDMDDAPPMGLRDVASVFPFAGPFAPMDGAPGDRFLHQALDGVDRSFLEQLLPVLQSRFQDAKHPCDRDVQRLCPHSDAPLHCLGISGGTISAGCTAEIKHAVPFVCSQQIQAFCSDDIEKGVLPCLEEHGSRIGQDCADAIIAAKHAISSLAASKNKAMERKKPQPLPPGTKPCPHGWAGPEANGCCTKRWAPTCAALCSKDQCSKAGPDWDFQWLDFRVHPYACCPRKKPASEKYIGGQPLCPSGWDVEPRKEGICCRRSWSWDCGHSCAEARCTQTTGWVWTPVDESKEHYRCCPDGPRDREAQAPAGKGDAKKRPDIAKAPPAPATAAQDAIPEGLGSSWVGQPINLAAGGWTTGAFIVGVVAVILLARRWFCAQDGPSSPGGRSFKEH